MVSGCLSAVPRRTRARASEVDAFIGLDQIATAGEIFRDVLSRETEAPFALISPKSKYIPDYDTPRFRLTPTHTTYLKIAEGCNHPCSFCVIPQMRGRHRSRTVESVVAEARRLVSEGIREINLISQDTTYYGMDLWQEKPVPPARRSAPRPDAHSPARRTRPDRRGFLDSPPLHPPRHWSDDLIQAIAGTRRWRATSTCRSSTFTATC